MLKDERIKVFTKGRPGYVPGMLVKFPRTRLPYDQIEYCVVSPVVEDTPTDSGVRVYSFEVSEVCAEG